MGAKSPFHVAKKNPPIKKSFKNNFPLKSLSCWLIPVAAVLGALVLPEVGICAAALIPLAMSTFGTVVAGAETMHASFAAGGVKINMQATSMGCTAAAA